MRQRQDTRRMGRYRAFQSKNMVVWKQEARKLHGRWKALPVEPGNHLFGCRNSALTSIPGSLSSIQSWARCTLGCKGTKNGAQRPATVFTGHLSDCNTLILPCLSLSVSAHILWRVQLVVLPLRVLHGRVFDIYKPLISA